MKTCPRCYGYGVIEFGFANDYDPKRFEKCGFCDGFGTVSDAEAIVIREQLHATFTATGDDERCDECGHKVEICTCPLLSHADDLCDDTYRREWALDWVDDGIVASGNSAFNDQEIAEQEQFCRQPEPAYKADILNAHHIALLFRLDADISEFAKPFDFAYYLWRDLNHESGPSTLIHSRCC